MNDLYLLVRRSTIKVTFSSTHFITWKSYSIDSIYNTPFCDLFTFRYLSIISPFLYRNLSHLPILSLTFSIFYSILISCDSLMKLRLILWFLLNILLLNACFSESYKRISLACFILKLIISCLCSFGYLPSYGIGSNILLGL